MFTDTSSQTYRTIWDYYYAEGFIPFEEIDYCTCPTCVALVTGK